ncbi:MAG: DNA-binding protein [Bacilli bacterium]|nr:DNA-binding protein [Bacilli bacterium]
MDNRDYIILLYDYYGELFSIKQREYFEDYYFNNLSLGEIGDNIGISRNAIHKVIKNVSDKLLFYEDKLQLYSKSIKIKEIINDVPNDIKKKIEELL